MKNIFFIAIAITGFLLIFIPGYCFAQKIDDDYFKYHLQQGIYAIDSDAAAVVLYENNSIELERSSIGFTQSHIVHCIIKILKPEAFSCANITVDYGTFSNAKDYISDIEGATYSLEGSDLIKTKITKADIYRKNLSANYDQVSFSLPAIKEGSVIEYSYIIHSAIHYLLPVWHIQGKYPKLVSEYHVSFPALFQFTALSHVWVPFKDYPEKQQAETNREVAYHVAQAYGYDNKLLWVRHDIPGIKEEPFVNNPIDGVERLEVQLTASVINGQLEHYINSWEKFDESFWDNNMFGKQVTGKNNFLTTIVDSLTRGAVSDVDKAKIIYKYVRANFSADNDKKMPVKKI